jgi:hypothetical protein
MPMRAVTTAIPFVQFFGLAVAGGASTARMQNANGVILEVRGTKVGFSASLDLSGLTISMQ